MRQKQQTILKEEIQLVDKQKEELKVEEVDK